MKLESQPEQPEIQTQSVVWQGNEYEDQNFEPDPVAEEDIEPNQPDVRQQWSKIKTSIHRLLLLVWFLIGGFIGWSICTYQYQNEATKAGVAHWECDPETGARTFKWNEK